MTKEEKEYNWLDDPFDEKKKAAQTNQEQKMGIGSKALVGCGCLVAAFAFIAIAFFFITSLLSTV